MAATRLARSTLARIGLPIATLGLGTPAHAHEGAIGHETMWRACSIRQINDGCSFKDTNRNVYRGTCQEMVEHLVCVRNKPIEYASADTGSISSSDPSSVGGNVPFFSAILGEIIAIVVGGVAIAWALAKRRSRDGRSED